MPNNNLICIDSHVVIWGIKKQSSPSQKNMISKTESFIEHLDESKKSVLIPSIVVAEILTPEPLEKQAEILSIISKYFIIGDFNRTVAAKYAEILQPHLKDFREYRKENEIRNDKMKFDIGIIATALVYNASCIYSYDKDLKTFASGLIDVNEIPAIARQSELFT
jgi:predicted nucleic acid-binding protein